MFYVYILWSKQDQRFYIGYTGNLDRRIAEHRAQGVHTTHRFSNFRLIFYEAFLSETDARRRERYFKTSKGKKVLRLMVRESLRSY